MLFPCLSLKSFFALLLTISCLFGLLLSSPAQTPSPKPRKYHIIVWMVQPIAKRNPIYKELEENSKGWKYITGFQTNKKIMDDATLLKGLEKANPNLSFSKVIYKVEKDVEGDETWTIQRPDTSKISIIVCDTTRDKTLKKMCPTNDKAKFTRWCHSVEKQLIVKMENSIIVSSSDLKDTNSMKGGIPLSKLDMSTFQAVDPASIFIINAGLVYTIDGPFVKGTDRTPPNAKTHQLATNNYLFCIAPLK